MSTRDISRSWKTANPADKMLMKMKRKGCSWVEIRTAWEELTGERPAPSTLPNRYSRIKDNMTRLEPGDVRVSPEFTSSSCFVPLALLVGREMALRASTIGTEKAIKPTWSITLVEDCMWASCAAKFRSRVASRENTFVKLHCKPSVAIHTGPG